MFNWFIYVYAVSRTMLCFKRTRILFIPPQYVWGDWEIRQFIHNLDAPCWGIMFTGDGGKQVTVLARDADLIVNALPKDCWHTSNETGCLVLLILLVIGIVLLEKYYDIYLVSIVFDMIKEIIAYI